MRTHILQLHQVPYKKIASGAKTIELRLFDEKRQLLSLEDRILFRCRTTGNECIRNIIALHRATSFMELLQHLDPVACGWEPGAAPTEEDMYPYYSIDQIATYGVVGIELSRE